MHNNDVQKVNEWKNNAIDKFLGAEKRTTPQILNRVHVSHSPGHFERKYGLGKKNLPPPLDLPTRNRICEAKICKEKEEKNRKYRKTSVLFYSFFMKKIEQFFFWPQSQT